MTVGIFSSNQMTQDLAKKSFAGMITRLMPNGAAPLFGMTSMMSTETAQQVEHGFFTKTMIFPSMQVSAAGQAAGDTLFTVGSTINVLPGQVFRVDAAPFENIIVNAVLSSTQVSVQRGIGTSAPGAIGANVQLYMIGNAYEEASLRPNALSINAVRVTNYTQIFRNTWALSGTVRATQVIAGDSNVAESKSECAAFHAADIEKALFFGQKYYSVRNNQPFHTMDGLLNIVTNNAAGNVSTLGATTNWTQLEAALDVVFNVTSNPQVANERVMFVGGTALRVINQIARLNGNYQLMDGQTSYGLQFRTLKSTRGVFRLIEHPLFNAYGATASWARMGIVVDLPTFNLAYLGGRKTENKEFNSQGDVANDNGIDAVGGTLTTELTSLVKNPAANAILYNFTAGAVG